MIERLLLFSPRSSDELYAYLTHCRPDLCILEGGEEEGEADRDEEEFVLIEDKEEEDEEEDEGEEEEVLQRNRSSGDDWEVSVFASVSREQTSQAEAFESEMSFAPLDLLEQTGFKCFVPDASTFLCRWF